MRQDLSPKIEAKMPASEKEMKECERLHQKLKLLLKHHPNLLSERRNGCDSEPKVIPQLMARPRRRQVVHDKAFDLWVFGLAYKALEINPGMHNIPVIAKQWESIAKWTVGLWLSLSPTTIPPLTMTKAPNAMIGIIKDHKAPTTVATFFNK